ncbi:MAG: acetylornithine transaminase [Syntrophaceae bacterium]|nr:acetylornithine transaminase [Syntrophaceae bacterium]
MTSQEWMERFDRSVMGTYKRYPLVLSRGEGCRVWDLEGKEYLDCVAGIAVCSLGHSHPRVVEAVRKQAGILTHISNLYYTEAQALLAERLVRASFADKVFFCNSGAEANEAAIKLARKYGNEILGGKNEIITMEGSFHGRTLATITATGQAKFQAGFEPLPAGFRYVPYNDLSALEAAVDGKTCAILVEPVQAEGGVRVPDPGYLKGVREICDRKGILLVLDEVQTGTGRTGTFLAHEAEGIEPDIATLAKALGNGFPVGAMLATDKAAAAFVPGNHASTFGGNLLAMAAGLAVMDVLLEGGLLEKGAKAGRYFLEKLQALSAKHASIRDVRGKGLLLGVEMDREVAGILARCTEKGLLVATAGTHVVRFVPPLVITEGEIDRAVEILGGVLEER